MKIVLAKMVQHDLDMVFIVKSNNDSVFDDGEYAQISEVIEVEFPMLEVDINSKKIELIDKDIQKAKAGIELLEQAKAELLAIPDMRAEK